MADVQIDPQVRTYIEGLLQDAGMTSVDDAMREEMIKELYVRLDTYLASVIAENLPPQHFDEFIKMNEEKKSKQEVETFLKDKVPSIDQVFAKAFADFRAMYLGNVAVARNAPAEEEAKSN